MDWSQVTMEDLFEAFKEVDWAVPPRSPREFFAKFTPPKTTTKWISRLKCNVYYYRANYLVILALTFSFFFFRNPFAFLSILLASFSLLCLNDSFATSASESTTRVVRKVNPALAARMRNAGGNAALHVTHGRRRTQVLMLGYKRSYVVLTLFAVSAFGVYITGALYTLLFSFLISFGVIGSHASMRTPNLKARLASAREEFRAVWRGYNDYTI